MMVRTTAMVVWLALCNLEPEMIPVPIPPFPFGSASSNRNRFKTNAL